MIKKVNDFTDHQVQGLREYSSPVYINSTKTDTVSGRQGWEGSIIGHRIDYNEAGVLWGHGTYPAKIDPSTLPE